LAREGREKIVGVRKKLKHFEKKVTKSEGVKNLKIILQLHEN
jgi:hypothetical protein